MKLRKKIIAAMLLSIMAFTGCAGGESNTGENPTLGNEATEATTEKTADEGTQLSGDTAILTVSFGTSYNESREKTIEAIEKAIADSYPDCIQRRAFTSQIIIDKLKERDGLEIDNVEEALDRLVADNVKNLIVQPTHIMSGYEYDDIAAEVEEYKDKFDSVKMGAPLLSSDEDYTQLAQALVDETAEYNTEGTAIVFMGHGTEHESNGVYTKLQETFAQRGDADNYIIGTVEAKPDIEDVVAAVKAGGYKKVVLEPLMVVSGDHATNDMAGDEEDSWKSILEKEGFEVECVLKGMGEFPQVQQMYVSHVADAMGK